MADLRKALEEVLAAPPETSAQAERAARAAEALAAYLRLDESVERLLRSGDDRGRRGKDAAAGSLAGLTLHEAAEQVLQKAGIPLHVRELGPRIKAGGWTHKRSSNARPDQILYQLAARLPRHPDVFVRVAPNTFGLVAWGTTPSPRPKPRVGLFGGSGKPNGRDLGALPEVAAGAGEWRSS